MAQYRGKGQSVCSLDSSHLPGEARQRSSSFKEEWSENPYLPHNLSRAANPHRLTKADIEQRETLEAALKVQQIMDEFSYDSLEARDHLSEQKSAILKGLVHSIPQIYAYEPRKQFLLPGLNQHSQSDQKSSLQHMRAQT